ncbi:MAG: hypothetical protein V1926_00600 [Candidatus Peregrinibacteria bacterium]
MTEIEACGQSASEGNLTEEMIEGALVRLRGQEASPFGHHLDQQLVFLSILSTRFHDQYFVAINRVWQELIRAENL